ncbi:KpsE Capsule polysaccharide export protein [Methylophilaceae bacterium]
MQTQNTQISNAINSQMDDDEINLMDILLVIAKYNRFIIIFTLISALITFLYVQRQPDIYTANTVIMPPRASSSPASMLLGQMSSLGIGASADTSQSKDTVILLKSHKLAYQVINRLGLQSIYKAKNIESARGILVRGIKIIPNKDGSITIECSDRDPKMAANIANAYVMELDVLNQTIATTGASRTRLFYEKQIEYTNAALENAEAAFKKTQKRTDFTPMELQSGAIRELVALLRSQITAKEIELDRLKDFATEANPQYRKVSMALAGLRVQLANVESANSNPLDDVNNRSLKGGSDYLKNMRNLKYQETLLEVIKKQYEVARLDEAKDANLIQVVDVALAPEQPSKPLRKFIVVSASLIAFLVGIILAFIINAIDTAKQKPKSFERLNLLRRYLLSGK